MCSISELVKILKIQNATGSKIQLLKLFSANCDFFSSTFAVYFFILMRKFIIIFNRNPPQNQNFAIEV